MLTKMTGLFTEYLIVVTITFSFVSSEKNLDRYRRSFQGVQFRIPERAGRKCHDFCSMMPDLCGNGGTCVINEISCVGSCQCAAGWTGKWCREPVRPALGWAQDVKVDGNDTDPGSSRMSAQGATIPDGVFSHLGDIVLPPTRPLLPTFGTNGSQEVVATSSAAPQQDTSTSDQERDRRLRTECLNQCTNGNCINSEDGGYRCKQRIAASDLHGPKVCGPGFECVHGVCDTEALENNSYRCICEDSYVGQFCTAKCPLECGEHGHCDIHVADSTYKCYCQWNYTGLNCSELIPEDPVPLPPEEVIFHWYVVGVSVSIVIVVLTLMMLLGYCMWRRRLVFVLKIVHYFQQYEDDDGKEFDAFVSYKSCPRDEEFVLRQLYPKLERDFQFKLCMHFRDFLPGEAIANNIVKAIESSRRTIMVLSPEYVKSEWCRMEYQKAQHEMLKLKHKIIPIVLEDLSEVKNVDKNLKSILNSVTYLEWPGPENTKKLERFWKKLELSLPKKSTQNSSSLSTSDSSSSSEPISDVISSESDSGPISASLPTVKECYKSDDRSLTDSPTPSSATVSSTSPKFQRKRKDFRHFMEKLVRGKFFNRQDSNSSQSALVDAETLASRSSCGSVTESMLTESSEPPSVCSSPLTPRANRSASASNSDNTEFFPVYSNVTRDGFHKSFRKSKELVEVCEKDHCDGSECETCKNECDEYSQKSDVSSGVFVNRGFVDDEVESTDNCEYCKYIRCKSDNNRIRISAIEGTNDIKIQKLPPTDYQGCEYCDHVISKTPYRGSVKHCKDAANELVRQNRVGSLPRNYKNTQILKASTLDCGIYVNSAVRGETNGTCYMDVCESV